MNTKPSSVQFPFGFPVVVIGGWVEPVTVVGGAVVVVAGI